MLHRVALHPVARYTYVSSSDSTVNIVRANFNNFMQITSAVSVSQMAFRFDLPYTLNL